MIAPTVGMSVSQQKAEPFWQTMPRSGNLTNGAAADISTYVNKHFLSQESGKRSRRGCDVGFRLLGQCG